MPKTRTLLALVLLPLLVFLVACSSGSDDDGDNGGGGSQPSTGDSSSSSGSTGDSTGDSSSSSGSSGGSGSTDASTVLGNCPELLGMFGAFTAGSFANPGAGNVDDDLEAAVDIFQNAADNAPSEIQADMQVLASAFADFYGALEELGVDLSDPATFATLDAGQLAQFQTAVESFGTAELEQASDNLDAWFTENCE